MKSIPQRGQIGVRLGIDFATQNFFRAGDRQGCNLLTQCLFGTQHFLLDLRLGSSLLAIAFLARSVLGFIDHLRHALLRLGHQTGSTLPCMRHLDVGLTGRCLERLTTLIGGSQSVSNGLLPRFDGRQKRRPDEADREPDERGKDDRLREHCYVDVHTCSPYGTC